MAEILTGQELHMTNVLSLRVKGTQADMQREMGRVGQFIQNEGLAVTGATVTTTFAVEGGILDLELLIPLDKSFVPPDGCTCKPEFRLVNAASIRHIGSPAGLQRSCDELVAHIQRRDLTAITNGYNKTVKDAKNPDELDDMIVDIYIGISPNVL